MKEHKLDFKFKIQTGIYHTSAIFKKVFQRFLRIQSLFKILNIFFCIKRIFHNFSSLNSYNLRIININEADLECVFDYYYTLILFQ